jgi:hypothetical protein
MAVLLESLHFFHSPCRMNSLCYRFCSCLSMSTKYPTKLEGGPGWDEKVIFSHSQRQNMARGWPRSSWGQRQSSQQELFTVHKTFLCRASDYFDKALNGPFLESSTGNLRLTTIGRWSLRPSTIGSIQDSSITARTNSAMKALNWKLIVLKFTNSVNSILSRIYANGS